MLGLVTGQKTSLAIIKNTGALVDYCIVFMALDILHSERIPNGERHDRYRKRL